MNLKQHLGKSGAFEDVQKVILAAAEAGKEIYQALKTQKIEYSLSKNISGERQLSHDLIADKILKKALEDSRSVSCFVSEERDTELCFVKHVPEKLLVAFDPIDGSSVAGAGLAVGTSLGIYRGAKNFLSITGRNQVAAMYLLYGPRVLLVYTVCKGVHLFVLNEKTGDFKLEQENIKIDEDAKVCGFGGMQKASQVAGFPALISYWEQENFTLRYSGSMTADVNGILKRGAGIFVYPAAKLRMLYECNPFALLVEEAGGSARDLCGRDILDIPISAIDARSPILIGAKKEVEIAEKFLFHNCKK